MRIRKGIIRKGVMQAVKLYIEEAEKSYRNEVDGIHESYNEEVDTLTASRDQMIHSAAESRIDKIVRNFTN